MVTRLGPYQQNNLSLMEVDPEHLLLHLRQNQHLFWKFQFGPRFYQVIHHHLNHIERKDPIQKRHQHQVLHHYPYPMLKDLLRLGYPYRLNTQFHHQLQQQSHHQQKYQPRSCQNLLALVHLKDNHLLYPRYIGYQMLLLQQQQCHKLHLNLYLYLDILVWHNFLKQLFFPSLLLGLTVQFEFLLVPNIDHHSNPYSSKVVVH